MADKLKVTETASVKLTKGEEPLPAPPHEDLGLVVKQRVDVRLFDEQMNEKWHEEIHNTVTTLGFQYIADALLRGSAAKTAVAGIELGTSATAASAGDTDVLATVATIGGYQAFDSGYPQQSTSTTIFQSSWAAGEGTNSTINEACIKSSDASTDAISRITFTTVNKGASDTLTITVTWQFQ